MWTLSRGNVATKPSLDIQSEKLLLTIIWNASAFYVVDRLPNDMKTNSAYFLTNLLTSLEQAIFPRGRALHEKRLVIRFDYCSVDASRASNDWLDEHDMRRMPQPPYSPDRASSDFCLFLTVKEKLERTQVAEEDSCFKFLQAILRGIDRDELNGIFQD
jgi:hypothetical protein